MSGLTITQVIVSIILIVLILIQERSSDISGLLGGGGGGFYRTRRGLEKFTFAATIVLLVIFAALSLLTLTITQ